MKNIFLCIIIISLAGHLCSYSLYENYELEVGKRISHLDARSSAMGGTGTASGMNILDNMVNPANLGFLPEGLGAQFIFDVTQLEENRTLPMYNFFDSYVDDATYVSNTNFFTDFAFAAAYKVRFGDFSLATSLDYKPFVNFNAYYEEQVRNNEGSDFDNYPPIIAKNFLESEGEIYSYGITWAVAYQRNNRFFDKSAFGINLNLLTGDHYMIREIIWSEFAKDVAVLDDVEQIKADREYDGLNFSLGLKSDISERITAGLMYMPGFTLDVEDRISGDTGDLDYPSVIRFGARYKPRNILRTTFHCDVEFVQWSGVSDFYENVTNYYIGVEHIFPHTVPLRLGFNYVTSPYMNYRDDDFTIPGPIIIPSITTGTGFNIYGGFSLDLSGEFSHRKYESMDLFPDGFYNVPALWNNYTPQDRTDPDTVREYYVRVKSSLKFRW